MPSSPPFFTVVIAAGWRASSLRAAIAGVLDQTFGDLELLVVDDARSPRTERIAASFDDPRVRYLPTDRRADRHGVAHGGAYNLGATHARGRWVAFLDGDDVWLPRKLERQAERIAREGSGLGLVYTAWATYDFDRCDVLAHSRPGPEGDVHRALLHGDALGPLSTVVVAREVLLALGGIDGRFAVLQGHDLYLRVAERTLVAGVPEELVHVRAGRSPGARADARTRLDDLLLFWYKHRDDYARAPELRYRIAARVFVQAVAAGSPRALAQSLPLVLTGLRVDPDHARATFRRAWEHLVRPSRTSERLPTRAAR